ncbi:MAG: thiamine pyrophosphate-binding protein, partial [Dehalococcoidales bacterium]|nr:thiamine pyrophosphate-binding protein [Dehalococcoidales bacterium]
PGETLWDDVDEADIKMPSPLADAGRPSGDQKRIEEAISLLQKAERPIIIAGSGVVSSEAGPELQTFVDTMQIPFFTTPLARGLIPEDHPLCFLLARSYAWKEADVALVIGTRANWIVQHLSAPRFSNNLKLIMANLDPSEIGHNRPADVGILGDAGAVLKQLTEQAKGRFGKSKAAGAWVNRLKQINIEKEKEARPLLSAGDKPIHPLRLCAEIRDILPRDSIVVVDGNDILSFARQSIPSYLPRHRLNTGPSGCVGTGLPFAIGAKLAEPGKTVVLITGDFSFGFNTMELDVAVRHKINVVVVVSNNGRISGIQEVTKWSWPTGNVLGFTRYDKIIEALGGYGQYVEEPEEIRPALEKAFASGKPAVVNVVTAPVRAVTQLFGSNKVAAV